ncbi:FecR family protein [bacterium]|nr:FecR family protein [bacterium]
MWSVLLALSVSITLNAKESSGKFRMVKGDVQVKMASTGKLVKAMVGLKVSSKDTIITAKKSRAKLVMVDGNVINLSPKTKLKLSQYKYNKKNNDKNVLLKVIYGKVRSKVNQKYDGKKNKFRIKTPTAVAGVRGTDFITSYNSKTRKSKVVTFEGRVAFGKINKAGRFLNPVSIAAGQTSSMGSSGAAQAPKKVALAVLKKLEFESDPDGSFKGPRVPASEGGPDKGQEGEKGPVNNDGAKNKEPRPEGDFSMNGPGPGMDDGRGPANIEEGMPMLLPEDFAHIDDPAGQKNFDPGLEPMDPRLMNPDMNRQPDNNICESCREYIKRTTLIINVCRSGSCAGETPQ